MIIPNKLNKGDVIGVVAPSDPIIEHNIEEVNHAKRIIEEDGFKVKFSKNIFSNSNSYSASAIEKAEDINSMFEDKDVKMIWCAKGGENCNSIFEYLNYELIKNNPKIICGYSDITSITNIIYEKTGLVTFSGTNFKTIYTDQTSYSYNEVIKRLVYGNMELGLNDDKFITIKDGITDGVLIGGNLSLVRGIVCGKYSIDFRDKILFIEEFGLESQPATVSNHLYYLKQNGVFDKIKGLWIGNYEHKSGIKLEEIVLDTLENKYKFPIIKSNNFGHIERKTVIPIGVKARIDSNKIRKIELIQDCVK